MKIFIYFIIVSFSNKFYIFTGIINYIIRLPQFFLRESQQWTLIQEVTAMQTTGVTTPFSIASARSATSSPALTAYLQKQAYKIDPPDAIRFNQQPRMKVYASLMVVNRLPTQKLFRVIVVNISINKIHLDKI